MENASRYGHVAALPQKKQSEPGQLRDILVGNCDVALLVTVIILTLVGIVMVHSASYMTTAAQLGNAFHYLQRHVPLAGLGFFLMFFAYKFKYKILKAFAYPSYIIAVLLLLAVAIFGEEIGGARRWIEIPFTDQQFQPSEVAKIALILTLACLISRRPKILDEWKGFFFCIVIVGVMCAFVGIGNMSTAIIIAIIGGGMIFVASPHIMRFFLAGFAGVTAVGGYLAYMAFVADENAPGAFRGARVTAWLNPHSDPDGVGFQILQSLYAIASGGWFGLGLGGSRQKTFLPEAHNDVIFAIIVEELGVLGAGFILLLFGILIWRGLSAAIHADDSFSALVAVGITLMIASQVIINVAVVTNSIPNTGIPMPFISYGGTALVVNLAAVGVLLNISRHTRA